MQPVKFGLIGAGVFGQVHAKVYSEHAGAKLAVICDLNARRAKQVAKECGGVPTCTDYREVLADPSITAVSVATPDFAHTPLVVAAAKAGKHVLCEKPLATTVADCETMIKATRKAGVKFMVDFHNRWNPPFVVAKEAIRKGELGLPRHAYYRLSDTQYVPFKMLSWASKSTVAWFLASHCIDTLHWLLEDQVKRVYCVRRREVLKKAGVNTPDFYLATLEFSRGTCVVIENSWLLPQSSPTVCNFEGEIVGDKGAIYFDTTRSRMIEKYTAKSAGYPDGVAKVDIRGHQTGFASESIRHFADCIIHNRKPFVTGEDGLAATRVICAMDESADKGKPVDL